MQASAAKGFHDIFKEPEGSKVAPGLCAVCKGSKMLCGKERCPLMVKFHSQSRSMRLVEGKELTGCSPPAVFVGRYGYPKVEIGPLLPPLMGDTSLMDTPERWVGRSIDEIVDFRYSMVRGMHRIDARDFASGGRIVDQVQEMALMRDPTELEASFTRRPAGRLVLDDEVQPFGPSAPLTGMRMGNGRFQTDMEKAYNDTDLKATEAVVGLYQEGVMISDIQKALSVGTLGVGKRRRFVPTRWSITAVDDTVGQHLLTTTKHNPTIDDFRIYQWEELDNRWCVMLMPCSWRYELIEAWYPNTTWNPYGREVSMVSDHEFFDGRKEYARIGGCYYAARMAVNELLIKERRQAGAVIFREAHPGYIMPVGVWNVRENVRAALTTLPYRYETLEQALQHVDRTMDIPRDRWIRNSGILKDMLTQRRLDDFL